MRKISPHFFCACAVVAAGALAVAPMRAADVQKDFPHPERIRYDAHSLIIDGKPIFIYSGSLHYFRCPKELWRDRMETMKAAGLNCVETYLAWDVHEPEEPASPDDFSKLRDMQEISDFIQTAQEVGLYVSIRPGPYICAEWDRGGFPGWLMKHRPPTSVAPEHQFLRGDSAEMLAWDKHWIAATAKVVKPHLVTNLPAGSFGVINWQLENEYDYSSDGFSSETRLHVLQALAHDAVDDGIDVPLFTCETTDPLFRADPFLRSHVYETTNKYPGFDMRPLIEGIEKHAEYQPENFRAISELQGGWFSQVGGKLSDQQGHNAAQINQLTMTAIEHGVTSMNYYMFYGGSNFGYGAAQNLNQSYDYNAPIREDGETGDRYEVVKAIAHMLQDHGTQFIHSTVEPLTLSGGHPDVTITLRRSDDGSQFYFLRNGNRTQPHTGSVAVAYGQTEMQLSYDLGAFGAKVLYIPAGENNAAKGEWLPQVSKAAAVAADFPAVMPLAVVSQHADPAADHWVEIPEGKALDAVNIFDQRYVTYRIHFTLSADDAKNPPALRIRSVGGGEDYTAIINGTPISTHNRTFALANIAKEGDNTADILFENHGCSNGGPSIEDEQGITDAALIPASAASAALTDWRMKIITGSVNKRPEVAPDFDDRTWTQVTTAAAQIDAANTSAVFRTTLDITPEQLAPGAGGVNITFGCIDDSGTLYINGQKAGSANSWQHPWTFDITAKLHAGKNSLAMVVRNDAGSGGIYNGCTLDPAGKKITGLQVAAETQSMAEHWENQIPAAAGAPPRTPLVWYSLPFQLPAPASNAALPHWHLHLDAAANGYVWLNGHNLGRYWAVGPQRDFWLPECWLKPGESNLISLQLHATADADAPSAASTVIKNAELRPYAEYTPR